MNKMILLALITCSGTAFSQTWVDGYTKKNGTYVQGHQKSEPNEYRYDNRNSQTNGGSQRDEYSAPPAYNKSNPLNNPYETPARKCHKDAWGNTSCF